MYNSNSNGDSGGDSSSCCGISSSHYSIIIFNSLVVMCWPISHKANYRDGTGNVKDTSNHKRKHIQTENKNKSDMEYLLLDIFLVRFSSIQFTHTQIQHNYMPNNRRAEPN